MKSLCGDASGHMAKAALRRLETWVILTRKRLITKGSRKRTDLLSNDHAASDDKFSASSTPKVASPEANEVKKESYSPPGLWDKKIRKEKKNKKWNNILERGYAKS
ncbi:hypothetical protein CEXT_321171 [Caerostris extrusa]|uniref:Uncharacterized protein n=1 Tax=Caerostris extrusa TaxID=172846 RepID=A0AAV4VSR9_CAEEX|nr:hypothetical protein CEXT_321171 [Caerostris extrusa]